MEGAVPVLRLMLAAAAPLQRLVDKVSPTHGFINRRVPIILRADGRCTEARWISRYLEDFIQGGDWADKGWKNIGHMYDPETGRGFQGWPSAPQCVREYWDLAVRHFTERALRHSFFYLGAAAHLVQDLCVPHHAAAKLFAGHRQFESYARRHFHRFVVQAGGLYDLARTPEGWVTANASYTRQHYSHCVTTAIDPRQIHAAIADLLPRAQRSTAGFVADFLRTVGVA